MYCENGSWQALWTQFSLIERSLYQLMTTRVAHIKTRSLTVSMIYWKQPIMVKRKQNKTVSQTSDSILRNADCAWRLLLSWFISMFTHVAVVIYLCVEQRSRVALIKIGCVHLSSQGAAWWCFNKSHQLEETGNNQRWWPTNAVNWVAALMALL